MVRFLAFAAALLAPLAAVSAAGPSLIPSTPSTAPDYFCTWNVQGFVSSYADANAQADAMTEANLFGTGPNQNWVEFYPDARGDLFLVLDDTWTSRWAVAAAIQCAVAWNSTPSVSHPTRAPRPSGSPA